ncbi:hypothetical protein CFP65_7389 [Kitasatospora sp. MMS16-BH015]|uniref:ferritin-like domain-containing protein n=1 Tax=Kitasatospora sp. MMS16-BH015 TaxID=2018025 RepID=UPI000CA1D527|nr:ferritin-like domain-containing protein [Kitasatospora sp. MMS16-BH015]AUG81970.1 hypothetical protein CFP65_7389 [Kitasatospora sp. MMS16-BH015]
MRSRITRHLDSVLPILLVGVPAGVAADEVAEPGAPPPEFNWRDYTVMLLHISAEIEHSLMVQYLFAAYSLGGPQVPLEHQAKVRKWQEIVLGIAKEEMGHFLTVQNLLASLGAPLNLDREDYPWGTEFYPFPFTLRRLTQASLATYVCAESPADWSGPEAERIKQQAGCAAGQDVNQVGALYRRLAAILADKERIPDTAFQAATLPYQASWDEWGRGYTRGERGQDSGNVPDAKAAELLILGVHSRDSALLALIRIKEHVGRKVLCEFTRTAAPTPVPIPTEKDGLEAVELLVDPLFARSGALDGGGPGGGPSPVLDEHMVRPGELTWGLCSPWQNDYRECACYYWAASRPDFVNVETDDQGTSVGNSWLAKEREPREYVLDDRTDSRLLSYDDLFRDWQGKLGFVIDGRDHIPDDASEPGPEQE